MQQLDPVKYLVTVTEHALLVELRVPIPVPDLTTFAVEHRGRLNAIFASAATSTEVHIATFLRELGHAG